MSLSSTPSLAVRSSSKPEHKAGAIRDLYEATYRMRNAISALEEHLGMILEGNSTWNAIESNSRTIQKDLLPALLKILYTVEQSAKHLNPMAGLKVIVERDLKKEENQVLNSDKGKKRKSKDIAVLAHYVTPHKLVSTNPPKRQRVTRSAATTALKEIPLNLPVPRDGKQYDKHEMLDIVEDLADGGRYSTQRSQAIKQMIELKYVPCKKSTLYNMISDRKEKKAVENIPWKGKGRRPLLDDTGFNEIVASLHKNLGRSFGAADIEKAILDYRRKKIIEAGHQPLNVPDKLNRTTLKRYIAMFALHPELSIATKTIRKTTNRFAAENSIIASFHLLLLIATTHFIEVPHENASIVQDMQQLPESTRLLYDLVRSSSGTHVIVIHPGLVINTDETTEYIFEGTLSEAEKDLFRLVSKKSLAERGTNSIYNLNEGNDMNGMRVKMTHTFTGIGNHAPLFITVSGLSEEEMPIEGNLLIMKVPGLCVGGGVGSNEDVGYVVFAKNTRGTEVERFT